MHAFVVQDHYATWWLSGAFFALLTAFQVGWGLVAVIRPAARRTGLLLTAGVAVNAAAAVLWGVTRWVTGEPFGPAAGTQLPVGPAGIASTLLELVVVAALLVSLRLPARPAPRLLASLLAAGLVLSAPTAWGVSGALAHDHAGHVGGDHSDDGHDGHDEAPHDDGHDEAPLDDGPGRTPTPDDPATGAGTDDGHTDDGHTDGGHGH